MKIRPSVLCPIDYSDASAGALRYAAAIAAHFTTRLIVLAVDQPVLPAVAGNEPGVHWNRAIAEVKVTKFVAATFSSNASKVGMCECDVAAGTPSIEILRVARERSCALIVMSSQGWIGAGEPDLAATAERVLRKTSVPVLVTCPAAGPHPTPTRSSWAELLGVPAVSRVRRRSACATLEPAES